MNMQKELGDNISHEDIKEFLWKTLQSGQVVPGYGRPCTVGDSMTDSVEQLRSRRPEEPRSTFHGSAGVL